MSTNISYSNLKKKYNIKNISQIKNWLNSYKEFGEDGLRRKLKNKTYPIQFKLDAIELYVTSKKSYQQVANSLDMNNPSLIANWIRQFKNEGVDGLSRAKGRPPTMSKKKNEINHLDKTDKEKIKDLEAQLLTLQIENAYLKELRKLRKQEEKQRMKLSRPSSLASEENSN